MGLRRSVFLSSALPAAVLTALLVSGTLTARAASASPAGPDFEQLAGLEADSLISLRRWLHAHPELSMREYNTQERLRRELLAIPGVELVPGEWTTGLVAVLRGGRPGPLLAYRADIDALPLREDTGLTYASTVVDTSGGRTLPVMHACGHDVHAAVLIGVARVFSRVREEMPGSVLFIVEPGEEIGAGARTLIEAGVFEKGGMPKAIYAVHDHPSILYGQVSYCPGRSAANVDEFVVRVVGKGGHGAYPHKTIDPVLIACDMVSAFQNIVSREVDAATSAVITVGSIHGGTTSNVIPEDVELRGTVRSLEPEVRELLKASVMRTAQGIAAAAGAPEPEIRYVFGTPSMYNDPVVGDPAVRVLQGVLGKENVIRYVPGMGGEDFSEFQKVVPGFMFRLGVGRPDRPMNLHSAGFDPDERGIALGVRLVCEVMWDGMAGAETWK